MKTKLNAEPPEDENMELDAAQIEKMNAALASMGMGHLQFSQDEIETREQVTKDIAEVNESVTTESMEEAYAEDGDTEPSFGATLGVRLGQFVTAAWHAGRPNDKEVPAAAMIQFIGTYLAAHRGEGMG